MVALARRRFRSSLGTRRRRVANLLIVVGLLVVVYGVVVLLWRDPVTDVYARWKQHQLTAELDASFRDFRLLLAASDTPALTAASAGAAPTRARDVVERARVRQAAQLMLSQLKVGQGLGTIRIPSLGVGVVFVHGTRWGADLSRGPGHYERTSLPGLGHVTAIAGHRTTFGAPFRHIDRLDAGDEIVLKLAYGTFTYRVVRHEIVRNDDWSVLKEEGWDTLVLTACHPLYSASHRWVVFAQLARVRSFDGYAYAVKPATRQ